MAPRYSQKRFSVWRPSAILNFQNFDFFFFKIPPWEWKYASVYKIWWKSDNSRLRHGDKTIFKMAAVRHLEFSKIPFLSCDLYLCVILYHLSKFRINQPIRCRDIAKKRFSIWRPSAILDLLWRHHIASENCTLCSQLCVKFSRHWVAYCLK